MTLSTLAILLGLAVVLPSIYALWKPAEAGKAGRAFPRAVHWGYVLVPIATVWFLYYLNQETIADFARYKGLMQFGFTSLGVLTCIFVKDYLSVRGLALVLLLLAKLMVDTARWVETPWRLVVTTWGYLFVLGGMWLVIAPWWLRDLIEWATADHRVRKVGGAGLTFGLFVLVLGVWVY